MATPWKPSEIIIHRKVQNDQVTRSIIEKCKGIPIEFVNNATPESVIPASEILSSSNDGMLNKIIAGKQVLFISPVTGGEVDSFEMEDDRILCPHFDRLKYAMNGCFYLCDWCYLKLTYRAAFPYIIIRAEYDKIIKRLEKKLEKNPDLHELYSKGQKF